MMLRGAAAILLSSITLHASAAPDAVGVWQGTLEREGAPLEVEVTIAGRGDILEGRFSAAQLRAVGIPLSKVHARSDAVSWQLVGDRTTMAVDAMVRGDTLTGTFKEGSDSGVVKLRRAAESRFAAREEEITFEGAAGAVLSGTILRPKGDGPFPGIVFLHGSGPEGRWASRYLAHEFVRAGFAALIYDKRGVGASKGDWRTAGFEELVDDASAAVGALRASGGITRVGIHGHSQGGTIAPWVAVKNRKVAFVVASAASGVSMKEAEEYSVGNAIRQRVVLPDDRELAGQFVAALVARAYDGAPAAGLESARKAAEGKRWLVPIPPDSSSYWAFSRRIASYDPLRYWRDVRVPALLVYGANDQRVPVEESVKRITAVAASKPEVIIFPLADHTLRVLAMESLRFTWPQSAPGYPERVIEWVRRIIQP